MNIRRLSTSSAQISYTPTEEEQEKLIEHGITGQFVVRYDVERMEDVGEILVRI